MKNKLLCLLVAVALIFCFVSCSRGGSSASSSASTSSSTSSPASVYVIECGYENAPGELLDLACNFWKEKLEELSGGTMTMKLYPSSELGTKIELMDMALAGNPVTTISHNGFYSDLGIKDLSIVFVPYLIDKWEDYNVLYKSDWYAGQMKLLQEKGIRLISDNWRYGVRHLLAKKPVHSLADVKGMKVRTPNSLSEVNQWVAMGANPTPMTMGEVYIALQQGAIDAVENPLDVLYANKWYEINKCLILTGHSFVNISWTFSEKAYQEMTPQQREWLMESGRLATDFFNGLAATAVETFLQKLKSEGVTVYEIDRKEWSIASRNFVNLPEYKNSWTPGLYEKICGIIGK